MPTVFILNALIRTANGQYYSLMLLIHEFQRIRWKNQKKNVHQRDREQILETGRNIIWKHVLFAPIFSFVCIFHATFLFPGFLSITINCKLYGKYHASSQNKHTEANQSNRHTNKQNNGFTQTLNTNLTAKV